MGQQEVLKKVDELGFTTLEELGELLNISVPGITHSLSKLNNHGEILSTTLGRRRIYFCETFFQQVTWIENDEENNNN